MKLERMLKVKVVWEVSNNQNILSGEGGVGFLVCECLVNEVALNNSMKYEESVYRNSSN